MRGLLYLYIPLELVESTLSVALQIALSPSTRSWKRWDFTTNEQMIRQNPFVFERRNSHRALRYLPIALCSWIFYSLYFLEPSETFLIFAMLQFFEPTFALRILSYIIYLLFRHKVMVRLDQQFSIVSHVFNGSLCPVGQSSFSWCATM